MGLFRIQGCVNPPEDNPGSTFTRHASDLHPSQGIAGMDANAHDVAGLDEIGIYLVAASRQ